MSSVSTFLAAFLAFRVWAVSAAGNYGYIIFYEKGSTTCANSAVTVRPWVSAEKWVSYGASSSSDPSCSTQSLCVLNNESEQCTSLDPGVVVVANITVLPNGTELACRNETDCFVSARCSQARAYPNCSFSTVSQAALLKDPVSLLQNTQFPASAINQTAYIVYHSDSQCSDFVGLYGYVTGNNSAVNITKSVSGVSCSDAMACLFNSEGASCQALGTNGTVQVSMLISDNGSDDVTICVDGACHVRSSSQCLPSAVYEGCYYRPVSGKGLFENPSLYLPTPAAGPTSSVVPWYYSCFVGSILGFVALQALV